MIPFGEYLPDQDAYNNPGSSYVNNVIPQAKDYAPLGQLSPVSDALTARAQGLISVKDSSAAAWSFAGDATKLYRLGASLTWTDVSQTSTTYSTPSTGFWQFAKFGQLVLATNNVDPIQKFNVESSSKFEDLGGSPPTCHHIAAVRDFVVLGEASADSTLLRWSAFNDAETWTVGTSQADTQTIQTGGHMQAIVGGEVGYVFMDSAIWRMTYEGPPTIFRFDEVEPSRGLFAPNAVQRVGRNIFYMSSEGFYVLDAFTGSSTPIGAEKVDRTVYGDLNQGFRERITTGVDFVKRLVFWSYPSTSSTNGTPDRLAIFNYATGKWSAADADVDLVGTTLSPGFSLESLNNVDDLDSLPYSLDSGAWNSTDWLFSAIGTDFKLSYFDGAPMEATLDTVEFTTGPKRSIITNVTPIADTSDAVVSVASRERKGDGSSFGSESSQQANGDCPLLSSGKFHKARLRIPADSFWTNAQGIDVESQPDGYF